MNTGTAFVLGHALYMKAVHRGKSKNDRIDSYKIATLLLGGMLPQAYIYPRSWRPTRDLLRRRLFFARKRGELLFHILPPTRFDGCPLAGRGESRLRP